jgi:ABC-type dipeptide/oligopeptide/nickel transport system ATPase component
MGKTILMVTHDSAMSRAADRILRIQDGVIMRDVAPVGEVVEATVSYTDMLRGRMAEIDGQLGALEGVQGREDDGGRLRGQADCSEEDPVGPG